jgi:hypothetical protein
MNTTAGGTDVGGADGGDTPSAAGGRVTRWVLGAGLTLVGSLVLGHVAISLAWLLVDPTARWRERSMGHALIVGGVLGVLLTLVLTVTGRASVWVRAAAVVGGAGVFVAGLSQVPLSLGGVKPSCVVVHVAPTNFPPEILLGMGADAGGSARMELLYSDEGWHHFRQADGRHLEMPRDRVVGLETCQEER